MKFVDSLPSDGRVKNAKPDYDTLRAHAGRWAEVGRYPAARRAAASSRGVWLSRDHADIEYTTRTVGDEVVVYLRAAEATA